MPGGEDMELTTKSSDYTKVGFTVTDIALILKTLWLSADLIAFRHHLDRIIFHALVLLFSFGYRQGMIIGMKYRDVSVGLIRDQDGRRRLVVTNFTINRNKLRVDALEHTKGDSFQFTTTLLPYPLLCLTHLVCVVGIHSNAFKVGHKTVDDLIHRPNQPHRSYTLSPGESAERLDSNEKENCGYEREHNDEITIFESFAVQDEDGVIYEAGEEFDGCAGENGDFKTELRSVPIRPIVTKANAISDRETTSAPSFSKRIAGIFSPGSPSTSRTLRRTRTIRGLCMVFDARGKQEAEAAPRDSTTQDRGEKSCSWNPFDGHSFHPAEGLDAEDVERPQYSP
ncbi:hypothetical protein FRB90_005424 [Tulasnella sp. 427]|nr:hypothetical protein FRB90_005424 [Tulasnella sp. 427]